MTSQTFNPQPHRFDPPPAREMTTDARSKQGGLILERMACDERNGPRGPLAERPKHVGRNARDVTSDLALSIQSGAATLESVFPTFRDRSYRGDSARATKRVARFCGTLPHLRPNVSARVLLFVGASELAPGQLALR